MAYSKDFDFADSAPLWVRRATERAFQKLKIEQSIDCNSVPDEFEDLILCLAEELGEWNPDEEDENSPTFLPDYRGKRKTVN